mmetsp:Transcript_2924/g.8576  ORF Transcript_2924/g.8576 Transcript_2924/m.8576 type:complete len:348 (+) Transcript_2924:306-1349(+)
MNRPARNLPGSGQAGAAQDLEDIASLLDRRPNEAEAIKLCMCFVGLQGSYVTWGFVQEKIMTQRYATGMFPSTIFLVCANRALALVVAWALMTYKNRVLQQPSPKVPFYQYSPCSISNIVSSWAQYECLKYVSFPTQTLFKSSKIIPVMLVGKFFHKKSYSWVEYLEVAGITVGVTLFMVVEQTQNAGLPREFEGDSVLGVLILSVYVFCDSFTSQWQDRVYKTYRVDQYAMMFGVNFFSLAFTACNLLGTGDMGRSLAFLALNPDCLTNVFTLSITNATGQLFIFYTIKKFGPIVFTIMMTTRQMLSLIMSCLVFGHSLGFSAILGTAIVFGVLVSRTKRKYYAFP